MKLLGFTLKREWKYLTIWIVGIVAFSFAVALAFPSLYPDKTSLLVLKTTYNMPTIRSMLGPVFGYQDASLNIAMAFSIECLLWVCLPAAMMSIFLVIRNTRADEEAGITEQILSLPVGRFAKSTAAILCALIANIVLTLLLFITTYASNLDGITFMGSLSYALSIGSAGFIFAAITLIGCEIFSTASGATTFAFAIFLISFLVRGIGDMKENILSYLSPLGLPLMNFPFYKDNNILLLYLLIASVVLILISFGVSLCRDTGAGIIAARQGSATGKIRSTFGLAFRLLRTTIISWLVGVYLIGLSYGTVIPTIKDFLKNNGTLSNLVSSFDSKNLQNGYIAMILMISSILLSVPVIMMFGKLYKEERKSRVEQVLSRPVSKPKIFASYLAVSIIIMAILPLFLALGMYSAAPSFIDLPVVLKACYAYLPAIFVMLGIECFFTGVFPKLKVLNWLLFTYSFVFLYFGPLLKTPKWLNNYTPFGHISQLPVQKLDATPLYVLSAIAVVLIIFGFIGYRKRDME